MKASAEAAWRASSRVIRRTRTLVSMARIPLPSAPPDSLFHRFKRSRLGRLLREKRPVNILRRELGRAPHENSIALFIPFQNGARTNTKLSANVSGDRNLSLGCKLRTRQYHTSYYQGNGRFVSFRSCARHRTGLAAVSDVC